MDARLDSTVAAVTCIPTQESLLMERPQCQYCGLSYVKLTDHEISCPCFTKACRFCTEQVLNTDLKAHEDGCSLNTFTCIFCDQTWQKEKYPPGHEDIL